MTKEELAANENQLFTEWRLHQEDLIGSRGFVKDGIVDFEEWTKTKPKVLFLLKEPNCDGEAAEWDDDLLQGLRLGGCNPPRHHNPGVVWRNWQIIARWAYHLTCGQDIRWDAIDDEAITLQFRRENLQKIAIVNLKKSGGFASCNWDELVEYVKKCGQFARRQIELYQPELIVCASNYGLLQEYLFAPREHEPDSQTTNGARWCRLKTWDCAVVDFYHFGYRIPANFLHFMLVDACREIIST